MRWLGTFKFAAVALPALLSLALIASDADARAGGSGSMGSRGSRTFSAPPTTNTAPRTAAPVDKSFTQPAKPGVAATQTGGFASRFGGWRSLLLGGLIGAGLASLFGAGALASVLGFVLQFMLIGFIVMLVMNYFRNRASSPATARAGYGAAGGPRPESYSTSASPGAAAGTIDLGQADFDSFERLLGEIQTAYGRSDLGTLGKLTTPEMLSYFAKDLEENRRKGVRNEVGSPKLLQGDLAETWRENNDEYATVAMRYSLLDTMVDSATGRVSAGSRTVPQEVTELWTFWRPRNGNERQWELSAIQQTGSEARLAS